MCFCRICIDDQHRLHCETEVTHRALGALRFRRSQCCCIQFCLCTASGDDLRFFLCTLSKIVFPRAQLPRMTTSSFLCLQPSLNLRKLSLLNSCSRIRKLGSIVSLPSNTKQDAPMWKSCLMEGYLLAKLVHGERYVCHALAEEHAPGHVSPTILDFLLSHRQLLEFALCFHSRAPDSQRERQRVGGRADILRFSALILFAEPAPRCPRQSRSELLAASLAL